MDASNHVKFKKIRKRNSHIRPEETAKERKCTTGTSGPKGQTRQFGLKAVSKEGKAWYKKYTKAAYFSDVCIDRDSLARDFSQILRQMRELGMDFTFAEPEECNLHMDTDPLVLTSLNVRPPYQAICHMLCGLQSMTQWTKHSEKRYHTSLSYAHMLRETRVWLKVVMNCLIPGLYYTDITHDRVCLVYALLTGMELNIGAIIKSFMWKARDHKGHKYAFGGLITKMCHG
ncbi:hypothetical protein H5410_050808 [Solanum commersonii]|uniref:Putative plant transposon protein domain-containing protein n=1 Tax=Solanum commersonii TaxID=4109 RepID=A0A9J5WY59_SOLCO|nr:hypothetical protein H5410_050808 [Solanum commersonii]